MCYFTQHMGSCVSHWGLGFWVGHVHILCHCNVMFMLRNTWALVYHIGVWRGACSHSLSLQRHVYATQHMGSGVSHWGLGFWASGAACSWSLSLPCDVCATQHMGSCVLHSCVSCIICIMEIISLTKIISSVQFGGGPYHFIEIKWGLWPPRYIYIFQWG